MNKSIIILITLGLLGGIGLFVWGIISNTQDTISTYEPTDSDVGTEVVLSTEEVAKRDSSNECWTIIEGTVYDITEYLPRHPGGQVAIEQICGRDGTELFVGQEENNGPHSNGARSRLELYELGPLTQ